MSATAPFRVLVVGAHPDDIDFGVAGSVATWTDAGFDVAYVVVTDGDAGGFERDGDRDAIPAQRQGEQRRAAAVVGVRDVTFLGYRDGEVAPDLALRRDLSRVIRRFRPDRVVGPSAERNYARIPVSHPDHLAVGEATINAVYPDARNPFAHRELLAEGLEPHIVHELWLVGHPIADHVVDITTAIDRKIDAILAHESQLPDPTATATAIRARLAAVGFAAGFGEESYAEEFFLIKIA
jgi:LmbE family N-acetylglucosaminyl deacetylase